MTRIPSNDRTRRVDNAESRVTRLGQYFVTLGGDRIVFVPHVGGRPVEIDIDNIPSNDQTTRFDNADSRVTRLGQYFVTLGGDRMVFVPHVGGRPLEIPFNLARENRGDARYDAILDHHKKLLEQED